MISPVFSSILDKFANTKVLITFNCKQINRNIEFFTSFVKQLSTLFLMPPNRIIKDFCIFFNIFLNLIDELVDVQDFVNEKDDSVQLAEITFMLLVQLISIFSESTKYMKDPVSDYNEWLAEYIEVICFNKQIGNDIFRAKNVETSQTSLNTAHSNFVNFGDKFVLMIILLSENEEFMPKILENLSVYFDIILKSIAVQNLHTNTNQSDRPKLNQTFVNLMEELMKIIFKGVVSYCDMQQESHSKILNNNVSDFLFSFFFLVDRGVVFNLIKIYLNELLNWTNPNMPYYVAKFLSIFIKSEEIMITDMIFVLLKNINSTKANIDLTFTNYLQFGDSFYSKHYLIAPWLKLVQLNTSLVSQTSYINHFILPMAKFLVSIDKISSTKFNIISNSEFSDFSRIFAACLFPLTEVIRQYSSMSFDKPDWMNSRVSVYSEDDSISICSSKYSTINSRIFGRMLEEKPERVFIYCRFNTNLALQLSFTKFKY
ncbi:hypothetical protein MXB_1338 [Myxobolus squamalis]|nr:hypothetical protein MXB_1338 [Myxobolus squamalis]